MNTGGVVCTEPGRCLFTGYTYEPDRHGGSPIYRGFVGLRIGSDVSMVNIPGPPSDPNGYTSASAIDCAPIADFCVIGAALSGSRSSAGFLVTVS